MEELTTVILSGITWDAIKKGFNISANYLKNKLSNWFIDDDKLEEISICMKNIPDAYYVSEGMIKEYFNLNKRLIEILEDINKKNYSISQEIYKNEGIAVTSNTGTININNTSKSENEEKIFIRDKLINHLKEIQSEKNNFEYDDKIEFTMKCLEENIKLKFNEIRFLEEKYNKIKYLFKKSENNEVQKRLNCIYSMINNFSEGLESGKNIEKEDLENKLHKMCLTIAEFPKFYLDMVNKKINLIIQGNENI